jgi:hypothetical protein
LEHAKVLYSERKGAGVDTHHQQRCAVFLSQIDEIVTSAILKCARYAILALMLQGTATELASIGV